MQETEEYLLKPVAHLHTDFSEKFGIPRQSGLVPELTSTLVFDPPYRNPDALRGIEGFSHLWLLWGFSRAVREEWSPTVRPPRLGGNVRMGVFATRSPFRPNPLGLSCVTLLGVEQTPQNGTVLRLGGADLLNGTPVFDIKPYLPLSDAHPEARGGFAAPTAGHALKVEFPPTLLAEVPPEKQAALLGVLAQDPRPAYQTDETRVYGMEFAGLSIRFTVARAVLTVQSVEPVR